MTKPDYLVIGAGVVGLSVARELRRRGATVAVIDKEPIAGAHASGKNSGVLHAGFYYTPDSLKARFTRVGNERLTEYCTSRGLKINKCGKLVVATCEEDLPRLDELHRRGVVNGVTLEMIDAHAAREIEPRAIVHERAIWSPTTSTIDPRALMDSLLRDARSEGIDVRLGTAWSPRIEAGFVVNAAGLGAVKIAHDFGFAPHYRMLPFRGTYLYSNRPRSLRTNLYPVPDPRFPFLGVHFTLTVDGHVKIGPTARPPVLRGAMLLATHPELRAQAVEEIRKMSRRHMVQRAAALATDTRLAEFDRWGAPGFRAQLYDTRKKGLEMDFVLEGDEKSMHVLNVVSPGLTCALPFAEHVVGVILNGAKDLPA